MRTFEYRQPRMMTHFGLEFSVDGQTYSGTCTDVSDGGIRVTFEGTIAVGSQGKLLLLHPVRRFELDAMVVHLDGHKAGLTFACQNREERRLCDQFVEMAVGFHSVT